MNEKSANYFITFIDQNNAAQGNENPPILYYAMTDNSKDDFPETFNKILLEYNDDPGLSKDNEEK